MRFGWQTTPACGTTHTEGKLICIIEIPMRSGEEMFSLYLQVLHRFQGFTEREALATYA